MTLDEEIRCERDRGELLGPLVDRYGAHAVVQALGMMHIAASLGIDTPVTDEGEESCDHV